MVARRKPNKAPKETVVTTWPSEDRFLPPASKKPVYANAGIQSIIRHTKFIGISSAVTVAGECL